MPDFTKKTDLSQPLKKSILYFSGYQNKVHFILATYCVGADARHIAQALTRDHETEGAAIAARFTTIVKPLAI